MRIKIILITLLFFITGCSLRPELPASKDIEFTYDTNSTAINEKWWEIFGNEHLNRLVEAALLKNSDLNLALNNVEKARVSLGLSKLAFVPNVAISGSVNSTKIPRIDKMQDSYSLSAVLDYEIDVWGRVRNSVNAANSMYKGSIYDYQAARLSIASNVVYSYFLLLSLKEQEEILSDTLETYTKSLEFRQNQLKAGAITQIVYFQTKSQVDSAKSQLIAIKNQISKANTAILILTGANYDEILKSQMEFQTSLKEMAQRGFKGIPSGISSDILLRRPDVASALEKLKTANYLIGVKRADYFPKISLTGMFGYKNSEFEHLFDKDSNSWSIGGGFSWVLNYGKISQNVKIATLDQNASLLNYEKVVKTAFGDVRNALNSREFATKEQEILASLLQSQETVYKLANDRYQSGYSDHLELLDSQRQLLSAKLAFSRSRQNLLNSVVDLFKAFGGGFLSKDLE